MTQQQLIHQLQDIMPEIVETKNPRAAMLKCAKNNNLSVAQLEKLGQVFNTYKTLVGLEKQATRGSSFSIVDVPDMVAEYSTYTPSEPATKKQKDVHAQINSWMNDVDSASKSAAMEWAECFTPQVKAASAKKLPSVHKMLDDYFKIDGGFDFKNEEEGRQWDEEDLDYVNKPDVLHKAASVAQETDKQYSLRMLKEASEHYDELLFNCRENVKRICGDIVDKLRQDDLDWQDVAYDLHDGFREKAAAAVEIIEDFFKQANYRTPHVALEKRGYTRAIPANRYGLYDQVDELLKTAAIHEQASEELVDVLAEQAELRKSASTVMDGVGTALHNTASATTNLLDAAKKDITSDNGVMHAVMDPTAEQKARDKAKLQAETTGALQQLILSDPVLQSADQGEVEDIYHTISNLAPTIAKDPVTVAPVLKEALQYGSLPIQQVKDLISAEKEFMQMKKYKGEAKELNEYYD